MEETSTNRAIPIISVTLLFAIGYAILRYHIMGEVPWQNLPFFIMNKGLSLAAFLLLVMNFSLGPASNLGLKVPASWLDARKALGMTGFLLVLVHVLMSLVLMGPASYGKMYEWSGGLSLMAGLSMLFGVLAFVALWAYNMSFQTFLREEAAFITFITSRRFMLAALLLGAAHLFFLGYEGWLAVEDWHGYLPPISLVAFVVFVIGYILNLLGRE